MGRAGARKCEVVEWMSENQWGVWTAWLIRHLAQLCEPGSSQIAETAPKWRHSHPHAVRSRNWRQRARRKHAASRQQQALQIQLLQHRWEHHSAHFNNSPLCSKTLWVCVRMREKWSMIQSLQPGDSGMEICSSKPIYGLRNSHHPTGPSFFSTTES